MDVTSPTAATLVTECKSPDLKDTIKADALADSKDLLHKVACLASLCLSILQDGLALLASLVMSSECLLRGSSESQ